ncbi:MAG: cob(I)yrinic acid a,c-diamide adenosyltransferase [Thermodesulfobacteriota bacterium]
MRKGLLMVFTGNGKGKTTAALGQAFRALGHGMRVCFIQFVKGSRKCGELDAAARFSDLLEIHVFGRGFLWESDDLAKDEEVAKQGWEFAKQQMISGRFQMVILDEITYVLNFMNIKEADVVEFLKNRPPGLHIVTTGRDAPTSLCNAADLVTVMGEEKHPYNRGVAAQRGVEF